MNKKKVLFLIHTLSSGGAERILINTVNNLDRSKYDITVMTVIDTGFLRNEIGEGITYKSILKKPWKKNDKENQNNETVKSGGLLDEKSLLKTLAMKIYSFLWKISNPKILHSLFIGKNYDVEIAFLEGIPAKLISSSNNKNSKKYCWIHVDLLNERKSEKFFINRKSEKKCYKSFDHIYCVSNFAKEQFIKKFNFNRDKVSVQYNPIDEKNILKLAGNIKPKKAEVFVFSAFGRLATQKRFDRLISVTERLVKENITNFKIDIYGEGPNKLELEKRIKLLNLDKYITLQGFTSNPYVKMVSSNMVICSSKAEGFSTVVCEAVVLGIPVITTNCSGMKEILGNSEFGLITENNTESLFQGVKSILTNAEIFEFYKEKVNERKTFFSLDKVIKEIETIIDKG